MGKITLKWPKMTKNGLKGLKHLVKNGPNEAGNTNMNLPDLKWWKISKK